jgi:hypothetical protein
VIIRITASVDAACSTTNVGARDCQQRGKSFDPLRPCEQAECNGSRVLNCWRIIGQERNESLRLSAIAGQTGEPRRLHNQSSILCIPGMAEAGTIGTGNTESDGLR